MSNTSLRRVARAKALGAILVIAGVVVAEIVGAVIVLLTNLSDSIVTLIIPEALAALVSAVGVGLLGGSKMLRPSAEDLAHTFRFAWWCLAVSVGLVCFDVVTYVSEGTAVSPDWFPTMCKLAVYCLFIGIFEECVFRGLVLQSMLGLLGGTHRGVVRAVLLTSLLFGVAHVELGNFTDALSVVQAILKIVQTGLYSILLCAIVLRTRRLGGVSAFHGFDDFLILLPGIAFFNESIDIEYVVQGDDAIPTIMFYLLVIGLYLPFAIKSMLEIKREDYVYRGAFLEDAVEEQRLARERERAYAEAQAQVALGSGVDAALPVVGQPFDSDRVFTDTGWTPTSAPVAQPSADAGWTPTSTPVAQPSTDTGWVPADAPRRTDDRGGRPPIPKGL